MTTMVSRKETWKCGRKNLMEKIFNFLFNPSMDFIQNLMLWRLAPIIKIFSYSLHYNKGYFYFEVPTNERELLKSFFSTQKRKKTSVVNFETLNVIL